MRIHNDLERHRARRTLTEVMRKLEEALRLSQELQRKGQHAEPTPSYRHR
jgi:hypothetical protein